MCHTERDTKRRKFWNGITRIGRDDNVEYLSSATQTEEIKTKNCFTIFQKSCDEQTQVSISMARATARAAPESTGGAQEAATPEPPTWAPASPLPRLSSDCEPLHTLSLGGLCSGYPTYRSVNWQLTNRCATGVADLQVIPKNNHHCHQHASFACGT